MRCQYCNNELPQGAKFCGNCGASISQQNTASQQQSYQTSHYASGYAYGYDKPVKSIGFGEAISLFFSHYADFGGRATRAEYWWIILFNMLATTAISFVWDGLSGLYALVVLVPGIALAVRRMHDIGKSGWNLLWGLIPLVGPILLIVWYCTASGPDNQYGPRKTQDIVDIA